MSDDKTKPWYAVHSFPLSIIIVASVLVGHFMGDRLIPAWSQFVTSLFGG